MGLPIACIKFCVLYRVAAMQHDRAFVPVLAHINPNMGNAGGIVCTDEKHKVARLRGGNAG